MKKALVFLLAALLSISACDCASSGRSSAYTVARNGTEYTVDWENGTISDGDNAYQFTFSGSSSGYNIRITYPDGSTYSWNMQRSGGTGFGSGGGSADYDANRYVGGDVLCDILESGAPAPSKEFTPGKVLVVIILLGIGLFNILSPQTAWYLSEGWKFRDAEPSDLALGLARAGGAACCLIGVILIFV